MKRVVWNSTAGHFRGQNLDVFKKGDVEHRYIRGC